MKRSNTFKVLFSVKRSRLNKNGESPVFMRITINGQRIETTLNLSVAPANWNNVAEKSTGKDKISLAVNSRLDSIRMRLMDIYRELELDGLEINPRIILNKYLGREENSEISLMALFKEHNDESRKLVGIDVAPGTLERYETSYRHTLEFMTNKYKIADIPLSKVDYQFIRDYEVYLKTKRRCSHNTTVKYLKNFRKIINIALARELIRKDPFANIKFTMNEVERDFLEDHELQKILVKKFDTERLTIIRDAFIFCSFTGLAFSDIKGLKSEHLVRDNNDVLWIRKRRQKTKNMCNIPLLEIPLQILERYKKHPVCLKRDVLLPIPTNQKMNAYLKEVGDLCGIKKQLTTHVARYTYATSVCLANGVSIENVAKMLGHSDISMTQHYARVLDKSILKDMKNVESRFAKISW